jgi:alkanesulfonate monooxygenase SsuD/methylene tetrahydromethanopterin reductase-like flavin-dependent oxidoreductase (luciferase family)
VVAALGPQTLRVAGRLAAGTSLAWVGPRTIREHIVPTITEAAVAAGRPAPRIIATLPVCVTDDADRVRARLAPTAATYGALPSYRAMFEREGLDDPTQIGIIGSAAEVEDRLAALADAGVTDFSASEFGPSAPEREATRALLVRLAAG